MSEELQKEIGDGQELTVQQIREQFKAAGIDTSVRKGIFEEIEPLLQKIHDVCASGKLPFVMAFDISNDNSIASGKSLVMSSVNLPGGIVPNMLREAAEIFRPKNELEEAFAALGADNLFLDCQKEGLDEHPDITRPMWLEKITSGETDLGYWQFVSAVAIRDLNGKLSQQAMAAVQQALAGQLPPMEPEQPA